MKIARLLPFLVVLLIAFTACKKKVAQVNADYVGYWEGSDGDAYYYIDIDSDSKARYQKVSGFSNVDMSGKAKIKGDKLKILLKKFHVDQHPKQDTSTYSYDVWTMVLDGITYYRY